MLGEEIKKARERAGLSQEELAFRADLHPTYISLLENNHRSPTVGVLFRLCAAMGTYPSDILRAIEKRQMSEGRKKKK